jgi:anti-anti-sigma factor
MDMATATAALAAITEVLRPDLNGRLLIDVSGLGYVDSAGLALFMNIVKLKGQPIVLRNPTPMFTKLLEVTALVSSGWFEIGDDSLE